MNLSEKAGALRNGWNGLAIVRERPPLLKRIPRFDPKLNVRGLEVSIRASQPLLQNKSESVESPKAKQKLTFTAISVQVTP